MSYISTLCELMVKYTPQKRDEFYGLAIERESYKQRHEDSYNFLQQKIRQNMVTERTSLLVMTR